MLRADKTLITINPSTGAVVKEVYVGKVLTNPVYYSVNNTIIGLLLFRGERKELP